MVLCISVVVGCSLNVMMMVSDKVVVISVLVWGVVVDVSIFMRVGLVMKLILFVVFLIVKVWVSWCEWLCVGVCWVRVIYCMCVSGLICGVNSLVSLVLVNSSGIEVFDLVIVIMFSIFVVYLILLVISIICWLIWLVRVFVIGVLIVDFSLIVVVVSFLLL